MSVFVSVDDEFQFLILLLHLVGFQNIFQSSADLGKQDFSEAELKVMHFGARNEQQNFTNYDMYIMRPHVYCTYHCNKVIFTSVIIKASEQVKYLEHLFSFIDCLR